MKHKFWWRVVVNAAALYVISRWLVQGLIFESQVSILLAGLVLGVVNALVRPLFIILSLPFNLLSLGLFTLVINGFMLTITAWLVPGFSLAGFGTAIWSAVLLSLFGAVVNALVGGNRR